MYEIPHRIKTPLLIVAMLDLISHRNHHHHGPHHHAPQIDMTRVHWVNEGSCLCNKEDSRFKSRDSQAGETNK